MPAILTHPAPAPTAARPPLANEPSATVEDSHDNQSFGNLLDGRLENKADSKSPGEGSAPLPVDAAVSADLAADGKGLPPDMAALIAASQPPSVQGSGLPQAAEPAQPVTDIDDQALPSLARAPLPAAFAELREPTAALARGARQGVLPDGSKGSVIVQGDARTAKGTPWSVSEDLLSATSGFKPGQAVSVLASPGVPAKDTTTLPDVVPTLTPPAPSATSFALPATTPSSTTSGAPEIAASIATPFGQAGWEQGLGNRVVWLVNQQVQSAELRMNPPHLGPIEVHISIRDDQASISFVSAHGQVREALQAAIPHLRDMLGDAGLTLSNVNVGQHSFADARQRPGDSGPQAQGNGAEGGAISAAAPTETLLHTGALGLIDYYA